MTILILAGSSGDPGRILAGSYWRMASLLSGSSSLEGKGVDWVGFFLERGLCVSPLACVNISKSDVTQYTSLVTVL